MAPTSDSDPHCPPLPNAPGLTSSEPTPLPNAAGLTSSIPENVEDLVELPINPDVLTNAMPSEPVCPSIPGLTFPELPSLDELGSLIGDKADAAADAISKSFEELQAEAEKLKNRIKNPPSPTDMMNEMANQVSSAADKAAAALEKAAFDIEAQVSANLAAEWDNIAAQYTELEAAMEAIQSGAVDLGALGMDALSIPGDLLAGAFAGFKNAAECLTGEAGSAEAEFNKKAPELDAGVDDGRGQDGATAALAISEKSEVVQNATGEEVSKQEVLTEEKRDELVAAIVKRNAANATKTGKPEKPITAKPVPVSANALPTERDKKSEYSSYMRAVGQGISGTQFTTFSGRKLTAPEQIRYDSGLPPIFVSAVAYYVKIEWGTTLEESQEHFDSLASAKAKRRAEAPNTSYASQEKTRERLVSQWKDNYSKQGKTLPTSAEAPYSSGIAPHKAWSSFGKWHPASYDVQASSYKMPENNLVPGWDNLNNRDQDILLGKSDTPVSGLDRTRANSRFRIATGMSLVPSATQLDTMLNPEKPLHPDADAPHITVSGDIDYEMIDPIINEYGHVYEWQWRSVPDPGGATNADGTPLLVEEQVIKRLR